MTELLLIRHAVNDFVKTGKLAGWTPEVHLNAEGRAQAEALGLRLAKTKITALYASPLERTVETAQAVLAHHPTLSLQLLDDIGEVRYGDWQGGEISKLTQRKLWPIVQTFPSRVRFPNGETMRRAQARAVDAIELLAEQHPRGRVAVVSHSDVIKMILAHYLGMHLDMFQRLNVSPASLSTLSIGYGRTTIGQINEHSYLPKSFKGDGAVVEIKSAQTVALDAIGEPGNRVFYLQVAPVPAEQDGHDWTSIVLEKAQALMLAEEIDQLFRQLGNDHPALAGIEPGEAVPLRDGADELEPVLLRAGKFRLQYEADADQVYLEIAELLGTDQGTPRILKLWATRQQMRTLGAQALQVAQRGRSN